MSRLTALKRSSTGRGPWRSIQSTATSVTARRPCANSQASSGSAPLPRDALRARRHADARHRQTAVLGAYDGQARPGEGEPVDVPGAAQQGHQQIDVDVAAGKAHPLATAFRIAQGDVAHAQTRPEAAPGDADGPDLDTLPDQFADLLLQEVVIPGRMGRQQARDGQQHGEQDDQARPEQPQAAIQETDQGNVPRAGPEGRNT